MKVYLLIVKSTDSGKLVAAHVFSTAEIARKHSDAWLKVYADVTAEVSPQVIQEE